MVVEDASKTFNLTTKEILSPDYPGFYPMDASFYWTIQIPTGTILTIGQFDYHFDCDYNDNGFGENYDRRDRIKTEGFVGGTKSVQNSGTNIYVCKGTWGKSTSRDYKMTILLETDGIRSRLVSMAGFKIKLSNLKRKKIMFDVLGTI